MLFMKDSKTIFRSTGEIILPFKSPRETTDASKYDYMLKFIDRKPLHDVIDSFEGPFNIYLCGGVVRSYLYTGNKCYHDIGLLITSDESHSDGKKRFKYFWDNSKENNGTNGVDLNSQHFKISRKMISDLDADQFLSLTQNKGEIDYGFVLTPSKRFGFLQPSNIEIVLTSIKDFE